MKPSDEIHKKIQEEIDRRGGKVNSIEDLNEIARIVTDKQNRMPHPDFEGLSPSQMFYIVNDPVSEQIIGLRDDLDAHIVSELQLVKAAMIILNQIDPEKGLKLTVTGKLPRKAVSEIHSAGIFKQDYDLVLPPKVMNEDDFIPAGMVHILLKLARFVRTSKNKMLLTRTGRSAMKDPVELFSGVYRAFAHSFNKAWFDRYESEEIGNVGFDFTIYLLSRYGDKMRSCEFYAEKYFKAFPMLADLPVSYYNSNNSCLEVRAFKHGLYLFGLVDREVIKTEGYFKEYSWKRSTAFENVFVLKLWKDCPLDLLE
ncbi:MAG: hypothetical protein ISS19_04345 [Bacteroidales bacterium]|nr:hypothetical protein [Bacteroidales bacterium]